jgi:hypothetical protein
MTGSLKTTCVACGWPLSEKSPDCERHARLPKATRPEGSLAEGARLNTSMGTENPSSPNREGKP